MKKVHCHYCDGVGLVHVGDQYVSCPKCGAPIRGVTSYEVEWNENKREFYASIVFPPPSHSPERDLFLQNLPRYIAERSRCSCGSTRKHSNHTLKTSSNEVMFIFDYGDVVSYVA